MFESKINRGKANGYAPLGSSGKVPLDYLPPIQSTLNTGSFATTGSNTFTGVQTIFGESGTSWAELNIGQDVLFGNNTYDIRASGSGINVTSDEISLFGAIGPDIFGDASLFANQLNGSPVSDGPIAALYVQKSGSLSSNWLFDYDGKSYFPGDIIIGYTSPFYGTTSGSLNITNGDINLSGSQYISGSVKLSTTNGSGDSLDLIIEQTNTFGPPGYEIKASGSTENALLLISNLASVMVAQGTVSNPGDTSLFATQVAGYPNGEPNALLSLYKSGSVPAQWFYESNTTSNFPGDINIGYDNTTSGSLNIRNGNINVTGSVNIDNVIKLAPVTNFPNGQAGMLVASASYGKTNLYVYDGSNWKWLVTGSIA